MTKTIEIEGNNFFNISGFYDEIQNMFSKDSVKVDADIAKF